jgi:aspartyl-tRNA(Asn)/glutamyl-tRNA(Gln) amidotransferase subunit A
MARAPLAWSLDHAGPMTRTAGDAALLLGVLSGRAPVRPVKELRLGLARVPYWQQIDRDVERAMKAAVDTMRPLHPAGPRRPIAALPTAPESPLPATYATVIFAEAYAFHREMLARRPDRYHAGTRSTIELGKAISTADYILARREMERLRATAAALLFRDVDALITPTAPAAAFKLGSQPGLVFLRNTAPWNLYGLPAISIPCGFSQGGLPIRAATYRRARSRWRCTLAGGRVSSGNGLPPAESIDVNVQ